MGSISAMGCPFLRVFLLFGESAQEGNSMLEVVVTSLAHGGLKFNASQTKVWTIKTQGPSTLRTPSSLQLEVLDRTKENAGWQATIRHQLLFTKRIAADFRFTNGCCVTKMYREFHEPDICWNARGVLPERRRIKRVLACHRTIDDSTPKMGCRLECRKPVKEI